MNGSSNILLIILAIAAAVVIGFLVLKPAAPPTTPEQPTPVEKPTPTPEKPKEPEQPVPPKEPEKPTQPAPPPETAGRVKNPNTMIEATIGDADTLDPIHAYDTASGEVLFHLYDNLITYDGPQIDRLLPMLATQVPTVENGLIKAEIDGTTYVTFPLRQGVKFHNGDALTPEDVVYSFRRIMMHSHPDSPAWIILEDLLGVHDLNDLAEAKLAELKRQDPALLEEEAKTQADLAACQSVKEAVIVQGQSVVFKLLQPSATFLTRIAHSASWGGVTNKSFVIQNGGWDEDCSTWRSFYSLDKEKLALHNKANGTGPFRLERWVAESEIVLVRNDNYWRAPAQLQRVVIKIVPEFGTRKLMLEQGDADIIEADAQFNSQLEKIPGVRHIYYLPTVQNAVAFFNYDIPLAGNPNVGSGRLDGNGIPPDFFTDIDVRKAFNYSFEWESFIKEVWLNEATQARGPIPANLPHANPENPVYRYDLMKAEEHFKQAWEGQVWERGFRFTVIYNEGNETRRIAAEILKENIEKLNGRFHVDVRGEPWPTYLDNFRSRRIPLFIIGWLADFPDPHNFVHPFMHSQGSFAVRQSLTKIANYDELIMQAARELDPKKREALYAELQQHAYEDAIDIFLTDALERRWTRTWVSGLSYNPMWPGINFYTLKKTTDGRVDPALLQTFPQTKIEEW